jgi:hypothetical protein
MILKSQTMDQKQKGKDKGPSPFVFIIGGEG